MKKELENALKEAIASAIADVSCDTGSREFSGVIIFDVSDGWTNVEITLD